MKMRRKSTRSATKASPEKLTEVPTRKSRRHSKRRKRSSSQSSSEESDDTGPKPAVQQPVEVHGDEKVSVPVEQEGVEQSVWKVTPSAAPSGEIQKLKLCLTRPIPSSPEKTERSSRRRRNKSGSYVDEEVTSPEEKVTRKSKHRGSHGVNVEEQEEESEEQEDKKGKGKSKTKHRSKSEKTAQIQEVQEQTQSEISENVQVTPQSPQAAIDIRVDNESVSTNEHETVTTNETETYSKCQNTNTTSEICELTCGSDKSTVGESSEKSVDCENDSTAQSPLTEHSSNATQHRDSYDSQGDFRGFEPVIQDVAEVQVEENAEIVVEEVVAIQQVSECEEVVAVQDVTNSEEEIVQEVADTEEVGAVEVMDSEDVVTLQEVAVIEVVAVENSADSEKTITVEVTDSEKIEEKPIEQGSSDQVVVDQHLEIAFQTEDSNCEIQEIQDTVPCTEYTIVEEQKVCYDVVAPEDATPQISQFEEQHQADNCESEDSKMEEQHKTDICEPSKKEKSHDVTETGEAPKNRVSRSTSGSSEGTEHVTKCTQIASPVTDKAETEEQKTESQASSNHKEEILDETSTKSVTVEGTHRLDEDSQSTDAIIIDSSSTPIKEDTSFNISQSFSPDIREIVQVNKALQDMKSEVCRLFQTPSQVPIKRKWGHSLAGLELIKPSLIKISFSTIKELCPDLQFLDESEVRIDMREARDRRKSTSLELKERRVERKVSIEHKPDSADVRRLDTQSSVNSSEMEEANEPEVDNSNIIAMNRKISIVDDTASKLKPPPSPAKNPISEVLYITNLVRPFTLKQLKELLERTGKIKENGFWTDRIKSKCYVCYETTEEAEATRNALHGVHWPIGNGKKLIIDYATQEDLEKARNPTPPPVIPELKVPEKENQENQVPPTRHRPEEHEKMVKERERHKSEGHVREWDIGKEDLHKLRSRSRERDSRNERNERRRHRRTPSPIEDFITRKQRKKEEDIPQKLMDDLFRKTKATPSIYWLPLTPEEIATKQQQRLLRMAEHKRRMEESSRSRGDYGRGAPYRRRYD